MGYYKDKGVVLLFLKMPKRRISIGVVSVIACLFVQCVFNGPINESSLTFSSLDSNGDTLSVFPKLRLVFSSPLADSSVTLSFSPAIARYGAYFNSVRDTLTIEAMDMLRGNARYVLRVEGPVSSSDGGIWDLSGDSTVFYTFPCEQEPNDKKNCSDTIASVMFGSISDVSDLDIFVCPRQNTQAIYLQSIDCRDSFFIEDGPSIEQGFNSAMNQADTVPISQNDTTPVFVSVRSGIKGFEGNYKLGRIEKK
jgi:hypothetical protein